MLVYLCLFLILAECWSIDDYHAGIKMDKNWFLNLCLKNILYFIFYTYIIQKHVFGNAETWGKSWWEFLFETVKRKVNVIAQSLFLLLVFCCFFFYSHNAPSCVVFENSPTFFSFYLGRSRHHFFWNRHYDFNKHCHSLLCVHCQSVIMLSFYNCWLICTL